MFSPPSAPLLIYRVVSVVDLLKTQISGEGGLLCSLNIVFLNPNILLRRACDPRALTVACTTAARAQKRETDVHGNEFSSNEECETTDDGVCRVYYCDS